MLRVVEAGGGAAGDRRDALRAGGRAFVEVVGGHRRGRSDGVCGDEVGPVAGKGGRAHGCRDRLHGVLRRVPEVLEHRTGLRIGAVGEFARVAAVIIPIGHVEAALGPAPVEEILYVIAEIVLVDAPFGERQLLAVRARRAGEESQALAQHLLERRVRIGCVGERIESVIEIHRHHIDIGVAGIGAHDRIAADIRAPHEAEPAGGVDRAEHADELLEGGDEVRLRAVGRPGHFAGQVLFPSGAYVDDRLARRRPGRDVVEDFLRHNRVIGVVGARGSGRERGARPDQRHAHQAGCRHAGRVHAGVLAAPQDVIHGVDEVALAGLPGVYGGEIDRPVEPGVHRFEAARAVVGIDAEQRWRGRHRSWLEGASGHVAPRPGRLRRGQARCQQAHRQGQHSYHRCSPACLKPHRSRSRDYHGTVTSGGLRTEEK